MGANAGNERIDLVYGRGETGVVRFGPWQVTSWLLLETVAFSLTNTYALLTDLLPT